MGRKKKEESITVKTSEAKFNFDNDENILPFVDDTQEDDDENTTQDRERSAEILVGDHFKILVTKRCFEVMEYAKVKSKDAETGEEIIRYSWKSHGYPGSLKHALHIIGDVIAKNKMFDKKTISSVSEAVKIYQEAYEIVEKLFHTQKEGNL